MKKNYIIPAIETTVLGYSLMGTNDPSADDSVKKDLINGFAPKRRTQPF